MTTLLGINLLSSSLDIVAKQFNTSYAEKQMNNAVFFFSLSEPKVTPPIDQFISEDTVPPICLPAAAQVVRLVPGSSVPKSDNSIRKDESEDDDPRYVRPQSPLGYLEVADVGRR